MEPETVERTIRALDGARRAGWARAYEAGEKAEDLRERLTEATLSWKRAAWWLAALAQEVLGSDLPIAPLVLEIASSAADWTDGIPHWWATTRKPVEVDVRVPADDPDVLVEIGRLADVSLGEPDPNGSHDVLRVWKQGPYSATGTEAVWDVDLRTPWTAEKLDALRDFLGPDCIWQVH